MKIEGELSRAPRSRTEAWQLLDVKGDDSRTEVWLLFTNVGQQYINNPDASNYIKELKQKLEKLNQDIETTQTSLPMNELQSESIDAQLVKQAVLRAINNWSDRED